MKHLLLIACVIALGLVALAGDSLPDGGHGDTYNLNGTPNGGEWNSAGPVLDLDPDGFGQGGPQLTGWWNEGLGCYQGPGYMEDYFRIYTECVGQSPDGGCNCWSYEIWIRSDNPPHGFRKTSEGLMY